MLKSDDALVPDVKRRKKDDDCSIGNTWYVGSPGIFEIGYAPHNIINKKIHSSCEIEDFGETRLCELFVILRSRVFLGVCPH